MLREAAILAQERQRLREAVIQIVNSLTMRFKVKNCAFDCALMLFMSALCTRIIAQTPAIDPSFYPASIYAQSEVRQAIQQSDGKRVLVGYFARVQGLTVPGLARLLANSNQVDATFAANVQSLVGKVDQVLLLPNGQLLLSNYFGDSLKLNTVRRRAFLRLNSDGTPDPAFSTGLSTLPGATIDRLLVQSDGKVIVTGSFTAFNGQTRNRIVRLNINGSVDSSFQPGGSGISGSVSALALQPDGKILLGGTFASVQGQSAVALARLLPDGNIDSSFAPQASASTSVAGLALQADGKIVVALVTGSLGGRSQTVQRLTSTGGADLSFQQDTQLLTSFTTEMNTPAQSRVILQADGRILLSGNVYINGRGTTCLVRLTAFGALDSTFTIPPVFASQLSAIGTVQPLVNGQLLVAGTPIYFGTATIAPAPVALLNTDGIRDISLALNVQTAGTVNAVVRQLDGKLIVGGLFNELNGIAASGLARLNSDGTIDASFTTSGGTVDGQVNSIAVQGDGKILVAGAFVVVGTTATTRPGLARFLPSGALDATFVPAIRSYFTYATQLPTVNSVNYQSDGQIVLSGSVQGVNGIPSKLMRLSGVDGQVDASFSPALLGPDIEKVTLHTNGTYLVSGQLNINNQTYPLCRLLHSGVLDPAFALTSQTTLGFGSVRCVTVGAAGDIYVGGSFTTYGALTTQGVARLLVDGTPDANFNSVLPTSGYPNVIAVTVQPNGRVLLGGQFDIGASTGVGYGVLRLLNNGNYDTSFNPANGPEALVATILVQPDGAIVAGGIFTLVSGIPYQNLVRLTADNVLAILPMAELSAIAQVWPIPVRAQEYITIKWADGVKPQRIVVRDALGQIVVEQAADSHHTLLNTAGLCPGVYLLTMQHTIGTATKRIVIE